MDTFKSLEQYTKWFNSSAYITSANNGFTSVAIPFLDHFNDYFQLFMKEEENGDIVITDGGNTISNLEMCGVDVSEGSIQREFIERVLSSKHLTLEQGEEIWSHTTPERFPVAFNEILQAVVTIDALYEVTMLQNQGASLY